jgi:hypothetical protein
VPWGNDGFTGRLTCEPSLERQGECGYLQRALQAEGTAGAKALRLAHARVPEEQPGGHRGWDRVSEGGVGQRRIVEGHRG